LKYLLFNFFLSEYSILIQTLPKYSTIFLNQECNVTLVLQKGSKQVMQKQCV